MYNNDHYKRFHATITESGEVFWEPGGIYTCSCDIDVTYYPFDDQICTYIFANWVYTGVQINLTQSETSKDELMEVYTPNSEWDVIGTHVKRRDTYYECCPEPYPEVHFSFHLRRKSLFYIMNIIIPSVMLAVLVLLVFRLPSDAGEKVSFGVTVLLAYSVFVLLISDNLPTVSNAVPLIRKFCFHKLDLK